MIRRTVTFTVSVPDDLPDSDDRWYSFFRLTGTDIRELIYHYEEDHNLDITEFRIYDPDDITDSNF